MTSDASYDTEDWSNDAENSGLHHKNKSHFNIYIQIENSYFKFDKYFTLLLYFWSNNAKRLSKIVLILHFLMLADDRILNVMITLKTSFSAM